MNVVIDNGEERPSLEASGGERIRNLLLVPSMAEVHQVPHRILLVERLPGVPYNAETGAVALMRALK